MAHSVILLGIDELQGEETHGTGVLETLRGYMPAVEAVDEIDPGQRTEAQEAVATQADLIAGKFETSGFTPGELATDTATLGTLIAEL